MKTIKDHGDFTAYYDNELKRNIWALGYFGGGSLNITNALEVAKQYSKECSVPLNTVVIDEILYSQRFKHFKIIYSLDTQQPIQSCKEMDNVFDWLHD